MRVIDSKPSPKVAKIVICRNCGVTIEYLPIDTKVVNRKDYTGCTDTYRVLICPECDNSMDVSLY